MPNNNTNTNSRGRFLLGRSVPSLRRQPNNKSRKPSRSSLRKPNLDRVGNYSQLSPLRENAAAASSTVTTTNANNNFHPRQPQQKVVSFPNHYYSKSPIVTNENVDATGFSKAELHDLEESFKLFDVYGEGSVQVGDLKVILEVLQQDQQQEEEDHDQQNQLQPQSSSGSSKYPHLKTLLHRLSELEDEDTLTLDEYIRLMASTTISNAIAIEGDKSNDANEHYARVFRLFDTDEKGYITLTDLERIAIELGEHDMTRGELQEMIDRAGGGNNSNNNTHQNNSSDSGGEKRVGIDDFTRMMTMSLFPANDAGGIVA